MRYGPAAAGGPNRGGNNYAGYGGQQNPMGVGGAGAAPQFSQDYYVYGVTIAALAAGVTNTQNIQVQADSDFEWIMSTVSGNLHGSAEPWLDTSIIPVTLLVTDAGSGRQLEQLAVPITTVAGTGKQPFILPVSRRFKSKSSITLAFTSFSASQWDNIFFNMIGRKIFQLGSP